MIGLNGGMTKASGVSDRPVVARRRQVGRVAAERAVRRGRRGEADRRVGGAVGRGGQHRRVLAVRRPGVADRRVALGPLPVARASRRCRSRRWSPARSAGSSSRRRGSCSSPLHAGGVDAVARRRADHVAARLIARPAEQAVPAQPGDGRLAVGVGGPPDVQKRSAAHQGGADRPSGRSARASLARTWISGGSPPTTSDRSNSTTAPGASTSTAVTAGPRT